MQLSKLNMLSYIFYLHIIASAYLGSVIIMSTDIELNSVIDGVSHDTEVMVWLALSYCMLAMPVSMVVTKHIWHVKSVKILYESYLSSPTFNFVSRRDSYARVPLYMLTVLGVATTIYIYHNVGIGNYVQLFRSGASAENIFIFRTEAARNFSGSYVIKNVFGHTLLPVLAYISLSYYWLNKKNTDLIWFLVCFFFAALTLVHDFTKSPLVIFLIGFLFLYILQVRALSTKQFIASFLLIIFIFIVIYLLINRNFSISYLFSPFEGGLLGRVVISQVSSLYRHFEIFPIQEAFVGLNSLSNFISDLLSLEHEERSARKVMEIALPHWIDKGYGGYLNTFYLGEAWANFGLVGIALSPVWVGFIIQSCYLFFLKANKTPIMLGTFAFFSCRTSINSGINDYLYNSIAFLLVSLIAASYFLAILLRNSIR